MNRLLLIPLSAFVLQAQDGREIMLESQKRTASRSHKYEGTLTVTDSKSKRSVKRWTYDRFGSHGESNSWFVRTKSLCPLPTRSRIACLNSTLSTPGCANTR